jgi:hypothetical protein
MLFIVFPCHQSGHVLVYDDAAVGQLMQLLAPQRRSKIGEGGSVSCLQVAGLDIRIESAFPLPPSFEPFLKPSAGNGTLSLVVERAEHIGNPGRMTAREGQLSYWRDGGDEAVALENFDGLLIGCLTGSGRWDSARLRIRAGADSGAVLKTMGEIYFRTALTCREAGLVLHAAGVVTKGMGIAFIGRSGMGKSTQAALWERWRGAAVLNDDRPAVTLEPGGALLHGTPWSGSSSKRLALSVPLAAVVLLDQAPVNSARLLTCSEAIPRLLPRIFMPYWSDAGMEAALATAERLMGGIRIIHLGCRPDPDAIACLERVLEHE